MKIRLTSILLSICLIIPTACLCDTFSATNIPWSGYWWPLNSGGLATGIGYRGHPAPFEKYDLLHEGRYPASLSTWYLANYYDPQALSWFGHCGAWSKASITETYPILPSSEENIIFRVGDKKGLLTIAHTNDVAQRGSGSAPEEFHYWLLSYIKDQSLPFLADLDASEEKWYYPIYQYDMQSRVSGSTESVTVTTYYVTNNVHPDFMGAKTVKNTYTYDLHLDSEGNIIGGDWTGDSVNEHPDLMLFPLQQGTNAPNFDYNEVRRIAANSDDFLEQPGETVSLAPGTYHLVLLDEDRYSITTQTDESFSLFIEKQEGSLLPLNVALEDGDGAIIYQQSISADSSSLQWTINNGDNSPYILTLSQDDYADPNIYTVTLDQQKIYMQQMPFLPKNGMWSGFALTNDNDWPVDDVMLTTHDSIGKPLHTILGPLSLLPGEKKIFLFDSLPWRQHELASTAGLTLLAGDEVKVVNLIGDEKILAGQIQKNGTSDHIIIPDTVRPMAWDRVMVGSVRNETLTSAEVTFSSYSEDGLLVSETVQSLTGHGVQPIKPGTAPFTNMPDKGWIEITTNPGQLLSGFIYLKSKESAEGIFALPVNSEIKYVPHVPPPGEWLTSVTIINASEEENQIRIHPSLAGKNGDDDITETLAPHEKRTIVLGADFGRLPGDPLHHSIIEIQADQKFVGYFSYLGQGSGEKASFPLLEADHFSNTLTMPHYPGSLGWWTGIGICNPLGSGQTVVLEGYNGAGELTAENIRVLVIPAGGYDIFTVESLFQEAALNISFVKCRTETPGGLIGGFFLYGGKGNGMLSGAVM